MCKYSINVYTNIMNYGDTELKCTIYTVDPNLSIMLSPLVYYIKMY